jgi:hypothetical protein
MVEPDADHSRDTAKPEKQSTRKKPPRDEFEQFQAACSLSDQEKAALPARLRRLLGWE